MRGEALGWIIGVIIILVLIVGNSLLIDYEKTECIASGGNWISGFIAGEYSYFCIPK